MEFSSPHPELLLLCQQVVVLIALVQSHQNVLQPVPHTKRELLQFVVQARLDVCKKEVKKHVKTPLRLEERWSRPLVPKDAQ